MRQSFRQIEWHSSVLARCHQLGFTLVELVMVIVIVGILAVFAAPRFFESSVFQSRGYADQVQATLRYAQKIAIAQRRSVCAAYTSPGRLALNMSGAADCDTPLNLPAASVNYIDAPSGVVFSMAPAGVSFDALGRPNAGVQASVDGRLITVETETGYVHQ